MLGEIDGKLFVFITTIGHYSLFPLLYPKNLLSIKIFMFLTHIAIAFCYIPSLYDLSKSKSGKKRGFLLLPGLTSCESLYLYGFMILCIYENALHPFLGLNKYLPFLPLMITSVYCALGVSYFWVYLYHYFLTFNLSRVPTLMTRRTARYARKVK